jgi:ATP-dependent RNA helicase RhlE
MEIEKDDYNAALRFSNFGFSEALLQGIEVLGFEKATPIQSSAIPVIKQGKDLIACAQTGTGKTAAFLLPIMDKILQTKSTGLNTLVIVPTRELAVQIDQAVEGLAYFTGISSIAIYGGGDGVTWDQQRKALETGADIIVATPGRLLALLQSGKYKFNQLKHLVLDEADRMLDMGFNEDIVQIVSQLPKTRQTLLFSATMPPRIRKLAGQILQSPEEISLAISKPAEKIAQYVYFVHEDQKNELATKLLEKFGNDTVIIFGSTKEKVRKYFQTMKRNNQDVATIHSDLEQSEREQTMNRFKNNQVRILIGTDIISRGIDVEGIGLVLNLDVPPDPEDYVHRIGRTARADQSGTAITLVTSDDMHRWLKIEKLLERTFESGPLDEAWKIPLPERFNSSRNSRHKPQQHQNRGRSGQERNSKFKRPQNNNNQNRQGTQKKADPGN